MRRRTACRLALLHLLAYALRGAFRTPQSIALFPAEVLNELYAATGQIGFRATQRVDGRLVQSEGLKCLAMKA